MRSVEGPQGLAEMDHHVLAGLHRVAIANGSCKPLVRNGHLVEFRLHDAVAQTNPDCCFEPPRSALLIRLNRGFPVARADGFMKPGIRFGKRDVPPHIGTHERGLGLQGCHVIRESVLRSQFRCPHFNGGAKVQGLFRGRLVRGEGVFRQMRQNPLMEFPNTGGSAVADVEDAGHPQAAVCLANNTPADAPFRTDAQLRRYLPAQAQLVGRICDTRCCATRSARLLLEGLRVDTNLQSTSLAVINGNNTFGVITTQANGPCLIQMAVHLRF